MCDALAEILSQSIRTILHNDLPAFIDICTARDYCKSFTCINSFNPHYRTMRCRYFASHFPDEENRHRTVKSLAKIHSVG